MKYGPNILNVTMINDGYIIIHNKEKILINTQNQKIDESNDTIDIENGRITIKIDRNEMILQINNLSFILDEFSYFEFIIDSIDYIIFDYDSNTSFNNFDILIDEKNNIDEKYIHINDLFKNENILMTSFADNFHNVKQLKIPKVEVDIIERNGMNIIYNPKIDDIKFNRKNSF